MAKSAILFAAFLSVASAASLTGRIVNGQNAEEGQFPYQVSIRILGKHNCGGSIINNQWVLTAAHCVKDIQYPTYLTVVDGSTKLSEGGTKHNVEKAIYHDQFSTDVIKFDIGLIKIVGNFSFEAKVQPIALNTNDIPSGADMVLSGWGIESYPGEVPPNDLKFLHQNYLTVKECNERYSELFESTDGAQVCAFSKSGEGACSGDSGGPLVYNGKVAGITSWVEPCGIGFPDVYTRVSEYLDWIQMNIN